MFGLITAQNPEMQMLSPTRHLSLQLSPLPARLTRRRGARRSGCTVGVDDSVFLVLLGVVAAVFMALA